MVHHDYIPRSEDSRKTWLKTFRTKLPTYGAGLGLSPTEISDAQSLCDKLIDVIQGVSDEKNTLQNLVTAKDKQSATTFDSLRSLAGRLKTNAGYTEAIGKDLGIIGDESTFDPHTAKPTLKVSVNGGITVIDFNKQQSNGIRIYGMRGAETSFVFLSVDTHSPYHDTRPNVVAGQPELRQFYAYYIDEHDAQFGLQSDTVSITE